MTYSQALKHFTKKLGLSKEDAVEKLKQLGYIPGQEEIVRLVENPKQYMSDYIDSVLVKKKAEEDVISKEDETTEINPLIIKQIESLSPLAPLHNPANLTGILAFK
jgi:acetate kinase